MLFNQFDEVVKHNANFMWARTRFRVTLKTKRGLVDATDALQRSPDTCIDCGACVPECPFAAIFPEDEVPAAYTAKGGEYIINVGLTGHFEGTNHHGGKIVLDNARQLEAGEVLDLTADIKPNYDFFQGGPGYGAKDQDQGM